MVVVLWKHMKYLFGTIAAKSRFKEYWEMQRSKLCEFVVNSPIEPRLRTWVGSELNCIL